MIAGRLTEFVELRKPFVETDAFGSEKISFPKGRLVHAEVNWKSGHLSQEASELFPDGPSIRASPIRWEPSSSIGGRASSGSSATG